MFLYRYFCHFYRLHYDNNTDSINRFNEVFDLMIRPSSEHFKLPQFCVKSSLDRWSTWLKCFQLQIPLVEDYEKLNPGIHPIHRTIIDSNHTYYWLDYYSCDCFWISLSNNFESKMENIARAKMGICGVELLNSWRTPWDVYCGKS